LQIEIFLDRIGHIYKRYDVIIDKDKYII